MEDKFSESNIIYSDDGFELKKYTRNYFYYFDKYDGFLDENGKYYDVDFKEAQKPEDSDAIAPSLPKFDVTLEELKESLASYQDANQEIIIEYQGFHLQADENYIAEFFGKKEKDFRDVYIKESLDDDDILSGELIVYSKKLAEEIIQLQLKEYEYEGEKYVLELFLENFKTQHQEKQDELDDIKDVFVENDKVVIDYTGFPIGVTEEEIKKFFEIDQIEINQYDQDTDPDFEIGQITVTGLENIKKAIEKHGKIYNNYIIELSISPINLEIKGFPESFVIEDITSSLKINKEQLWEIDFDFPLVKIVLYSQSLSEEFLKKNNTNISGHQITIEKKSSDDEDDEDEDSDSEGGDDQHDDGEVDEDCAYIIKGFTELISDINKTDDGAKLEELSNQINNNCFNGYKKNICFTIPQDAKAEDISAEIKNIKAPPKSYLFFTEEDTGYIYFIRSQNLVIAPILKYLSSKDLLGITTENFIPAFDPRQDKNSSAKIYQ